MRSSVLLPFGSLVILAAALFTGVVKAESAPSNVATYRVNVLRDNRIVSSTELRVKPETPARYEQTKTISYIKEADTTLRATPPKAENTITVSAGNAAEQDGSIQTSLIPGTITSGLTVSLIRRPIGAIDALTVKMNYSELLSLRTFTQDDTSIQLPETSQRIREVADDLSVNQSLGLELGPNLGVTITRLAQPSASAVAAQGVAVQCPRHSTLVGGGYNALGSAHPGAVDSSYPQGNGWVAQGSAERLSSVAQCVPAG